MRALAGLFLCALFLASFLPAVPSYAFEREMMGDVTVPEGRTVPEVSTGMGDVLVEGEVEGDVRSGYGDISVEGPVGGDVEAGSGEVRVDAPVGGDVKAGYGDVSLGDAARVEGDVSVGSGSLDPPHPDAYVGGTVKAGMAPGFGHGSSGAFSEAVGWTIWAVLTSLLVAAAVLLTVVAPRPLRASARSLEISFGRSLVLGLVSLPVVIVLSGLLLVTVIGGLLLPLLWPAYAALVIFGLLVAAYSLGRRVVLFTGRHRAGDPLAAAVGAVLIALVALVPILGGLVFAVLALLGAGGVVSAFFARWRWERGTPRATYASYEEYLKDRD